MLDHKSIDDAFFERLDEHFSEEELLDLSVCVGFYMSMGRMTRVLGVQDSCSIDP